MSGLSASLSQLLAPDLVPRLSYEQCFAEILADFRARAPEFDALLRVMALDNTAAARLALPVHVDGTVSDP